MNRVSVSLLIIASAVLAGCGEPLDELPRRAIDGSVSLNGEPLAKGTIQFVPRSAEAGTQVGAIIENGRYSIAAAQGPVPGMYGVMISGASDTVAAGEDDPAKPPKPAPDPVPARYNSNTTLEAEVKKEGSNTFSFELKAP
ncbi:MAG: hypothetical protein SFX72_01740 [Isosphaeraceae bacterium]|nr:hypothetical protein [Isosphaeraceae bacterium]